MTDMRIPITIAALLLTGCATTTASPAPAVTASAPVPVAPVQTPTTGLPAQTLAVGECGLFLWTRHEEPDFVFFSKAGSETAAFWFESETQNVTRIALGGDIFGQQLTEQDFALPDGRSVELRMTPGDMLVGGQRVPEASLTVVDAEGWRTMIPVAGVTACQPEN